MLAYWIYIVPTKNILHNLKQQNAQLERTAHNTQLSIIKLQTLARNVHEIKHDALKLMHQQAYANSLPMLFNQLSQMAAEHKVTIDAWMPLAIITHKHYLEYPVQLTIRGNYVHVYQSLLALIHMHFMHIGSTFILERIASKSHAELRLTTQVSIERILSHAKPQLSPASKSAAKHVVRDPFKIRSRNKVVDKTLKIVGVVLADKQRWALLPGVNGIIKHVAQGAWIGKYRVMQITAHKVKLIQVTQNSKIIWLDVKAYA